MPRLVIDNREIDVPAGTKVIQAAEQLGIMIPRFCYHEALGSLGACRMCAVIFKEGPVKGLDMSCMVDAQDGMVVSTQDPEAVAFRKWVIECLMLNHPHDCPVCDEGGHCLLQDQTVSAGHGTRRYQGKKRTYADQDLGPFVQHEMNRCIHCWRCRRFYQDFAGYRDLGAMQIGSKTYFGRFRDGPLESPFSGNLIDICPTGVYTDRTARFKGRRWNFERAPSLCLHCSLGCNTVGSAGYREVVRQEARLNEQVNGYFICDRGRFGFDYANLPDRPRRAMVGEKEAFLEEGIMAAAKALNRISRQAGPASIACIGSVRSSLETQAVLKRFCRSLGWADPRFFTDPATEYKAIRAVARLDRRLAMSLRDMEDADFILAVGADPINEAPMLALAMRQAYRKGASIVVMDPRPIRIPFVFEHLPVASRDLELCLSVLVKRAVGRAGLKTPGSKALDYYDGLPDEYSQSPHMRERLAAIGEKMQKARRPAVICGTDIVSETMPDSAADLVLLMKAVSESAGLFYLLPGPNGFGAALLTPDGRSAPIVEAIERGGIRALILVENDLFRIFPDQERLARALDKLELLLVLDYLPTRTLKRAHIVLPTTTLFERTASSFVNQEGRLQLAQPVYLGGTPIRQISGGGHPPRSFEDQIPGGDPKAAHEMLADLYAALSKKEGAALLKDLKGWLAGEHPAFKSWVSVPDGARLVPDEILQDDFSFSRIHDPGPRKEGMELVLTDWTFGTEELFSYSRFARNDKRAPEVFLHPDDARRLGLSEGEKVMIHLGEGEMVFELHIAADIAAGVILLPRHPQVKGKNLTQWPDMVLDQQIHRL